MATRPLPRLIRLAGRAFALLALVIGSFVLAGWIGSSIPRNADWEEPDKGVLLLVETNGTHTGIVMPILSPEKDWRETFPSAAAPRPDGLMPTHIAIGWGEREVFMETPTWGDLKYLTALRVGTVGGPAVIRVSHYVRPAPGPNHRPLLMRPDEYARLVAAIEASLAPPNADGTRTRLVGTQPEDAYYAAQGRFTMATTCNAWVGRMLGKAGVKVGWWTPFPGGVTKHFAPPATQ